MLGYHAPSGQFRRWTGKQLLPIDDRIARDFVRVNMRTDRRGGARYIALLFAPCASRFYDDQQFLILASAKASGTH